MKILNNTSKVFEAINANTYSSSGEESFAEQRRRLLKRNLLAAVVRDAAGRAEEQLVLEPNLLRLAVVLDVDVDRHREAAVARLSHLVRGLLDYCNAKRSFSRYRRINHYIALTVNLLSFNPNCIDAVLRVAREKARKESN